MPLLVDASWVRVSQRGRWHRVVRSGSSGAYHTSCGRVLPMRSVQSRLAVTYQGPDPTLVDVAGPAVDRQCDKCRAA